jgi:hypothetical protein
MGPQRLFDQFQKSVHRGRSSVQGLKISFAQDKRHESLYNTNHLPIRVAWKLKESFDRVPAFDQTENGPAL